MRAVAVLFLVLCLCWLSQACASAPGAERDTAENCAGWHDMSRGLVACEAGDRCAYTVSDTEWECTCGNDVQLFWCHKIESVAK